MKNGFRYARLARNGHETKPDESYRERRSCSTSDAVVSLASQTRRLYPATQRVEAGHTDRLLASHLDGDVGVSDAGQPVNNVSITDSCAVPEGNGVRRFITDEVAAIGEAFTVRDIVTQES